MKKNRYVILDGSAAEPMKQSIAPGDRVVFLPDTDETDVAVTFSFTSPFKWKKNSANGKGESLEAMVEKTVKFGDRFPYVPKVGVGPLANPELIVDGGLSGKKKKSGAKKTGRKKR
jgi:hypothetical protein